MSTQETKENDMQEEAMEAHEAGNTSEQPDTPATEESTLASEVQEMKNKHMRLYAEFENFRRRSQKEKLEIMTQGGEKLAESLLTVLDDVARAQKAMQEIESAEVQEFAQGQALIFSKLFSILEGKGLKKMIEVKGQMLDTDFHEAITQIPAEEPKGTIIDVVEDGYFFNEKVLRYAKVVVAQ